jgi:hypothetical protein
LMKMGEKRGVLFYLIVQDYGGQHTELLILVKCGM